MIFQDLYIKNKYIELDISQLDFSQTGIYYIKGENGVGKSTLVKEIVFGNVNAKFNDKSQKEAYISNRASLIGYVPQSIPNVSLTASSFIKKDNKSIDEYKLLKLLKEFELDDLNLKQNVKVLSGGEKVKLAIISAFLKEAPYLILDEPSNNLDDHSVSILLDLLKEYSHEHTVIIVSHDPRVQFQNYHSVFIENNSVKQITSKTKRNEIKPKGLSKVNTYKFSLKLISHYLNVLGMFLFMLILIVVFLFNFGIFQEEYILNENIESDTIGIYTGKESYPNYMLITTLFDAFFFTLFDTRF